MAARVRVALLIVAAAALLAAPSSAWALAGGATGGGGGGGGGGSTGGGVGGSSSECGETCSVVVTTLVVIVGVIVAIGLVLGWLARRRQQARTRLVEAEARRADADDGYWRPEGLYARVHQCFFPVQTSWERRDVEASRPFVSDALYERHKLQLEGLAKQNRRNRIQDLRLKRIRLVRIHNVTDDSEDRFVAHVSCAARDWMEDTTSQAVINGNSTTATDFDQYWSFVRHPAYGWVLDEIQQFTEGDYHETSDLVNADDGPPAYAYASGGGTATLARPAAARNGATATHPPNWYPDPRGEHGWRYWDGHGWTDHTAG